MSLSQPYVNNRPMGNQPENATLPFYKTNVEKNETGQTIISYDGDVIVAFDDKQIFLQVGEEWSKAIERRMNQASEVFGLEYKVVKNQKIGKRFLIYKDSIQALTYEQLCGVFLKR